MTKPKTEGPKRHKQPPVPGGRPHRIRVQVTDRQLQALQQLSDDLYIGIPEILISSALDAPKQSPKALANELAGIRQIITQEAVDLGQIAATAPFDGWDPALWERAVNGIEWRNATLRQRYKW